MTDPLEITDVTLENVDKAGFFCRMSKGKTVGNQAKLSWVKERLVEGMKLKIITKGGRGFIEYIPGEFAWRAVEATGYMFIHCIWVVGKSKKKGCGSLLLDQCLADARERSMKGVAVVTSEDVWLPSRAFFEKRGFELVDEAPPGFQLWALRFNRAQQPRFPQNWNERCREFGAGLTVLTTAQCPYIDDAAKVICTAAKVEGIEAKVVTLDSRDEMMRRSPSAYGVFGVVYDGRLLSYHYLLEKDLKRRIRELNLN